MCHVSDIAKPPDGGGVLSDVADGSQPIWLAQVWARYYDLCERALVVSHGSWEGRVAGDCSAQFRGLPTSARDTGSCCGSVPQVSAGSCETGVAFSCFDKQDGPGCVDQHDRLLSRSGSCRPLGGGSNGSGSSTLLGVDGGLFSSDGNKLVGSDIGGRGKRGPNYERNKLNRDRKARRKLKVGSHIPTFSSVDASVASKLQETRALRFIAENEVAVEKSRRQLAVIKALDVDSEIRQKQVKTRASIEREMVSIEKTHSQLAASGNVPGDLTGFEATILGSISPDSSASMAEFRKCQKDLLDSEEYNARLVATLKELGVEVPHSAQSDRDYNREMGIWTDNSENRKIVDEQFPNCDVLYNVHGLEGKMKLIPTVDIY